MALATESQLANLHELLAQVLAAQVGATEEYLDENGELEVIHTATPATLAIAAKFLKDNDITCVVDEDENLGRVQEIIEGKQKKGRLALVNVNMKEA